MNDRPRVLIEDWLPVAELGIESRRERAAASALPPLSFLHVWWARRPLVASAGVILASLLPSWTEGLAKEHAGRGELKTADEYHRWLLRLCGILGDPVAAKRELDAANAAGIKLQGNGYGYRQAFRNSPTTADLSLLHDVLVETWGALPSVIDPTAGGGAIPYAAIRLGLPVVANDLNPVAASVLRAGVELPAICGTELVKGLEKWGGLLCDRLQARLEHVFPMASSGERVTAYIFARTVACPRSGKPVPLSPNWWLRRDSPNEVAVRLVTERGGRELDAVEFEIVTGSAARESAPDHGTMARGDAISPWDNLAIDGEYIKAEAHAGRMGSQLYAVAVRVGRERRFRPPTAADLNSLVVAESELERLLPGWEGDDILPTEEVPVGNDTRPIQYGMPRWRDLFSPRQLLVHGTFVEEYRRLVPEVRAEMSSNVEADAVLALLGLMIGKAVDWDSLLSVWNVNGQSLEHAFARHDFSFKWSFAEFDGARALYRWCLAQLTDSYGGLAALLPPADADSLGPSGLAYQVPGPISVTHGTAGDLTGVESKSQTLVCIDPPYYDNVMYAELSDFFYVWEKRTLGLVWPGFFSDELTDKKAEAVANPALFSVAGKRKRELATADYEAKMQAIFAECHRVLIADGVMTVMFTHKRADAWDALGMAVMEAGFTIETSWPVNTERTQSLHQAKKNAAASTIMLVCRKRSAGEGGDFFEDVEPLVRSEARRALEAFTSEGIGGVDLLLATYGPALSVISSRWPVYSSEADPVTGRSRLLRPEEALDAARAEVTRIQRSRLVGREQSLDPISDFTMVAWDTFKAVEFPFDEARRLALAIGGLDIDELRSAKVLEKKSGTVVLLPPAKRVRREADLEAGLPGVYPEATGFAVALDGVHTAIYIADVDGLAAAKAFLDRGGLTSDPRFLATLQGLVNAIPRTKIKGEWVVPEAGTLDRLSAAYFPDIALPPEPETPVFEQSSFLAED